MKLNRILTISSTQVEVVNERVVLGLNDPGRAQFTIQTAADQVKHKSALAFDIGYSAYADSQRLFLGVVESVMPVDSKQCRIFCREFSSLLNRSIPLNLRHPTLRDVLKAVQEQTGLSFSVPDQSYSSVKIPHFASIGNGYQVLDNIGRAFRIDDFMYQQQGEGVIYVGSWQDSRWNGKTVTVDHDYFTEQLSSNSASIAAIPALRPGVMLNGNRIKTLEFSGNLMNVSW